MVVWCSATILFATCDDDEWELIKLRKGKILLEKKCMLSNQEEIKWLSTSLGIDKGVQSVENCLNCQKSFNFINMYTL